MAKDNFAKISKADMVNLKRLSHYVKLFSAFSLVAPGGL
jgi:hypothetical protein